MRTLVPFNHDWLYCAASVSADAPDTQFSRVTLPHTNIVLPHHNFDDREYQFISTYRKRFTLPEPRQGRRVYLDFAGAMLAATVTVNGHTFPEHRGGYTPFSFDITQHVHDEGDNLLTVQLDSRERIDIPPFGHTVDYLVFGGLYREVTLRYVEPAHIVDVFIRPADVLTDAPRLEVDITVRNQGETAYHGELGFLIYDPDGQPLDDTTWDMHISLEPGVTETFTLGTRNHIRKPVRLWSPDDPALYRLDLYLDGAERFNDDTYTFGFREARFREDGFYLNGERLFLRGLNRHQNYPYIGAAAPARLQRHDAEIIKYELGCNIVRTSHYPQSKAFLKRCDEIGLLVFEEIPGWQHIGDADWKALALRDVRAMIERDRNHPAIILWGVRINESWDDHDFYTQTNALARALDPTRQTGGVRFWQDSEFLEDVFTFNDFSNSIQEPKQTPHLVTEFNGHMFPTKTWDHDKKRVEHALRHARVQDRALGMGGVSGAIGWCAFDYNTHREFGAGDRICYHGVMDIFRLPKYAAYAYESQLPPSQRVVLRVASNWAFGDYDEGLLEPVVVFSNCDTVEAFVDDVSCGRFQPDRAHFPYLPHPPFMLTGLGVLLAQPKGELRVVGYIDGQPVAEQRLEADGLPRALTLTADDTELHADGIDMTRLVFRITDKYGNTLPYSTCAVTLTLDGPGELIGENPFPLVGGQAALYLKSDGQPGTARITASAPRLPSAEITIKFSIADTNTA